MGGEDPSLNAGKVVTSFMQEQNHWQNCCLQQLRRLTAWQTSCVFHDGRAFGTAGCFDKALRKEDTARKHLDTSPDSEVFVVISGF